MCVVCLFVCYRVMLDCLGHLETPEEMELMYVKRRIFLQLVQMMGNFFALYFFFELTTVAMYVLYVCVYFEREREIISAR